MIPRYGGTATIGRRDLLRLAGTVALAAPLAAACSRFAWRDRSLVVGLPSDPAGLSPLLQTGLLEASVWTNIYDPLVALDAAGQLQPALAESWRALDDRTWEFRLRPGVTFHNDEPFDAAAVRFTLETLLNPESKSPIRAQLAAIERVETPEPLLARIVTRQPFAPLVAELTALAIVPPAHTAAVGAEGLDTAPVGTGPFRFVERVRDDRLVLRANPRHWRGAPAVERVELRPIPDPATRLAALRAGEVDLATNLSSDQVATLERDGLRVVSQPGVQTLYLRLNARRPPLDDARVRRALALAIDVDRLIATLYGGHARRVAAPFPSDVFGYDPTARPTAHDPAAAKQLLAASGHLDNLRLVFEAPRGRYPKDDQVPLAVAASWQEIGVRTEVRAVEWAAYLQKINAGQGEDVFLLAGTNRTFDPHFTMARLYATASNFGRDYYGNPAIDPLVEEAAATLDPDRRRALYHQLLGILRADVPAIWLAQLDDIYAARPTLTWHPRADSLLWLHQARVSQA